MSTTASQNAAIYAYLKEGNKLTQLECTDMFGCTRLASRIYDIKKMLAESGEGRIVDEWVTVPGGNPVKAYSLTRMFKRGQHAPLSALQWGDRFCLPGNRTRRFQIVDLLPAWPQHTGVLEDGSTHTQRWLSKTVVVFLRSTPTAETSADAPAPETG
jgi:hypothetical protein